MGDPTQHTEGCTCGLYLADLLEPIARLDRASKEAFAAFDRAECTMACGGDGNDHDDACEVMIRMHACIAASRAWGKAIDELRAKLGAT